MKCIRCWKESKWELCLDCKDQIHNACSMMCQNKNKLIKLLKWDWLTPEWFDRFILYSNNILKYWKIYMEYKDTKRDKIFKRIAGWVIVASSCVSLWCIISLVIIRL